MRFLVVFLLIACSLHGSNPSWWSNYDIIFDNDIGDNHSPANIGQLKNFALQSKRYFDAELEGGAGVAINQLVSGYFDSSTNLQIKSSDTDNFTILNQGQLKNIARLFYDRLHEEGITVTQMQTNDPALNWHYPWSSSTTDDENYAPVTLGQLKYVFSFSVTSESEPMHNPFLVLTPLSHMAPASAPENGQSTCTPGFICTFSSTILEEGLLVLETYNGIVWSTIWGYLWFPNFNSGNAQQRLNEVGWVYSFNFGWLYTDSTFYPYFYSEYDDNFITPYNGQFYFYSMQELRPMPSEIYFGIVSGAGINSPYYLRYSHTLKQNGGADYYYRNRYVKLGRGWIHEQSNNVNSNKQHFIVWKSKPRDIYYVHPSVILPVKNGTDWQSVFDVGVSPLYGSYYINYDFDYDSWNPGSHIHNLIDPASSRYTHRGLFTYNKEPINSNDFISIGKGVITSATTFYSDNSDKYYGNYYFGRKMLSSGKHLFAYTTKKSELDIGDVSIEAGYGYVKNEHYGDLAPQYQFYYKDPIVSDELYAVYPYYWKHSGRNYHLKALPWLLLDNSRLHLIPIRPYSTLPRYVVDLSKNDNGQSVRHVIKSPTNAITLDNVNTIYDHMPSLQTDYFYSYSNSLTSSTDEYPHNGLYDSYVPNIGFPRYDRVFSQTSYQNQRLEIRGAYWEVKIPSSPSSSFSNDFVKATVGIDRTGVNDTGTYRAGNKNALLTLPTHYAYMYANNYGYETIQADLKYGVEYRIAVNDYELDENDHEYIVTVDFGELNSNILLIFDENDRVEYLDGILTIKLKPSIFNSFYFKIANLDCSLDNNRDGVLTYKSEDRTETNKPFLFWLNNDNDYYFNLTDYPINEDKAKISEVISDTTSEFDRDRSNSYIDGIRDLEDFVPLNIMVKGIETELLDGSVYIGFKWKNITSGNPSINLFFNDYEDNFGYINNINAAMRLISSEKVISLESTNTYTLSTDFLSSNKYSIFNTGEIRFLYEGVWHGKGELQISLYKRDGTLIHDLKSLFIELRDIKKMYVRSGQDNQYANAHWTQTDDTIIFVHGWRMSPAARTSFAETFYKRLWHRGFKGHYAAYQWDTGNWDHLGWTGQIGQVVSSIMSDYNGSEEIAWNKGVDFKSFVTELSGSRKHVAAHSMGNIVVGSALLAGMNIENYALMQAAVPAACYDDSEGVEASEFSHVVAGVSRTVFDKVTPDSDEDSATRELAYRGRLQNVSGNLVNFHLTNDYATYYAWELNNDLKPVHGYKYAANAQSGQKLYTFYLQEHPNGDIEVIDYYLTDPYESMSYAAASWSRAVGTRITAGAIDSNISLTHSTYQLPGENSGFGDVHSGQFHFPIQNLKAFYDSLLLTFGLPRNP